MLDTEEGIPGERNKKQAIGNTKKALDQQNSLDKTNLSSRDRR